MTDQERARAIYDQVMLLTRIRTQEDAVQHITEALQAVRREVWEEAAKECQRIVYVADAAIEGCDGDEFIRFNAICSEFAGMRNLCKAKATEGI